FREDLYYRINVISIDVPSLKERKEELPQFVEHFIKFYSKENHKKINSISQDAFQSLINYNWPGNIRELENLIRYLMVTTPEDYIQAGNLPPHIREQSPITDAPYAASGFLDPQSNNEFMVDLTGQTWPGLEKIYVHSLLKKYNWNITWAAKASGINRSTFASRMRKLSIKRTPPL
ncbi:MAG: hydrogenase, partial [Proteobacteria bacterium]|nr:hydrogenase [Pseudomonadota bacterium]